MTLANTFARNKMTFATLAIVAIAAVIAIVMWTRKKKEGMTTPVLAYAVCNPAPDVYTVALTSGGKYLGNVKVTSKYYFPNQDNTMGSYQRPYLWDPVTKTIIDPHARTAETAVNKGNFVYGPK